MSKKNKLNLKKVFAPEGSPDRFLLMVGYSPNKMPRKGADGRIDLASPRVVEKACWRFAANGFKGGTGHKPGGEDAFKVVENYVYRNSVPWVMKAIDGSEQKIEEGDWLIGVICTQKTWEEVEVGVWGSGSIQGACLVDEASPESLARVTRSVA